MECFESYSQGKCPREMEIIDNLNDLQLAMKELKTVIYFELDKDQ